MDFNIFAFMHFSSKKETYQSLEKSIKSLWNNSISWEINCLQVFAAYKHALDFWWIGLYFVQDQTLILGPFQGPSACTHIGLGKGVCGKAWQEQKSILVPNVHLFEGHIACSSESNSEIVVPLISNKTVVGVLDVDATHLDYFDQLDQTHLESLAQWIMDKKHSS